MKNINLTLPKNWDDLNQNQLKQLAKLLFYKVERSSFDLGVLLILLEIKWYQFKKFKQARMLVLNHRFEDIKKHYSFIYNQTNLKKFIPSITIGKTTYNGPAPFLLNVTAYEFSVADDMYLRFNKAKTHAQKLEFAQYLAGILYLRQNSIPFNVTN